MKLALAISFLLTLAACGEAPAGPDALTACCGPDAVNCIRHEEVSQDSSQSFYFYTRADGSNECSVRIRR